MTLSEKLIKLRKDSGWSQEELADRLGISRQAVSKWESAASLPDIDRLYKLSKLYGVSVDYLLDDKENQSKSSQDEPDSICVDKEAALEFISIRDRFSLRVAAAVSICILSPVVLILLAGLSEYKGIMSEEVASGVGVCILLLMIASAVSIFLWYGFKAKRFEAFETEDISIDDEALSLVMQYQSRISAQYIKHTTVGVIICILSPIPLFISLALSHSDFIEICSICMLLIAVSLGVNLITSAGIRKGSVDILTEEGGYKREQKRINKRSAPFTMAFWLSVTAMYLLISFLSDQWNLSWIIWPVAALIYVSLRGLIFQTKNRHM